MWKGVKNVKSYTKNVKSYTVTKVKLLVLGIYMCNANNFSFVTV